jgi:hypothetical protein
VVLQEVNIDLVGLLLLVLPGGPVVRADSAVGFPQKGHHLNPTDLVAVEVPAPLAFWEDLALVGFLDPFPLVDIAGGVVVMMGRA